MFHSVVVQRIFSILLLAIFSLPLVTPLLALGADGDAGLPACCRNKGRHHCSASMGEPSQLTSHDAALRSLPKRCPYFPGATVATHTSIFAAPPAEALFISLATHPTGAAQTESKRRISRDRSRQKRGPPIILL